MKRIKCGMKKLDLEGIWDNGKKSGRVFLIRINKRYICIERENMKTSMREETH
jgi:hypothetical protein